MLSLLKALISLICSTANKPELLTGILPTHHSKCINKHLGFLQNTELLKLSLQGSIAGVKILYLHIKQCSVLALLLQHLTSFLIHLFSTYFFLVWTLFYSFSIPVATSTVVEVDLLLYAFLSRFVTVTVMLKRQRHSGCFFSYLTDTSECSQCFTLL